MQSDGPCLCYPVFVQMTEVFFKGLLAQLVARSLDMGEVTGSSPVETTNLTNTSSKNSIKMKTKLKGFIHFRSGSEVL